MFYDQWSFCLVVMVALNFKKEFLKGPPSIPLKQFDSNLVQMSFEVKGNSK